VYEASAVSVLECNGCDYGPEKLIDNDPQTFYASKQNGCTKNLVECTLWVQLDLRDIVTVRTINVFNRQDGSGERTSQLRAMVGIYKVDNKASGFEQKKQLNNMNYCDQWPHTGKNGELIDLNCLKPVEGSVVVIQVQDQNVKTINMAEVKIYGTGKPND